MRNHTWFLFMIGSLALLFTSSVFLPRDQKEAYRYHYKGSISYSEGNVKQANSFFRKAYHLIPNNFYFAISYGLTTGQIGNKSEGLAVIGKARQSLAYNDPEVKEKNALATFFTGLIYAYNHQFDLAYKNVNNCLPQFPNDSAGISVIQNTLGFLRIRNQANNGHKKAHESPHYHVHRRDLKAALHHFEQALTYDPSNTTAQYNYQTLCDTLKVEPKLITQLSLTLSDDSKPYTPTFINMHVRMINALELPSFDDVLFLVDISGSMVQERVICMNDTRFDVMKELARKAVKAFPEGQQYGLATIGGTCTSEPDFWRPIGSIDRQELDSRFRFLIPDGTTPLLSRLMETPELFSDSTERKKTIFLISDGANTCRVGGVDVCQFASELASKNITINVLTFLSTTLNNTNAFAEYICLAERTGGHILYMDNYHCRLEPLSFDLLKSCQFRVPTLQKSNCWGAHINSLWNIYPVDAY